MFSWYRAMVLSRGGKEAIPENNLILLPRREVWSGRQVGEHQEVDVRDDRRGRAVPKLPDAGAHVNDQEMPLMAAQYACVVKAASRMSTRKRVVVEDPPGPGCDSSMPFERRYPGKSTVDMTARLTWTCWGWRRPRVHAQSRRKREDRTATSVAPWPFSPSRSRNQVVSLDGVGSRLSRSRAR